MQLFNISYWGILAEILRFLYYYYEEIVIIFNYFLQILHKFHLVLKLLFILNLLHRYNNFFSTISQNSIFQIVYIS